MAISKSEPPFEDFYWVNYPEPHAKRRQEILKRHPEIKRLMGVYSPLKYILFTAVSTQLLLGYISPLFSWPAYCFLVFFVGATLNHFFMMGIHELSHNICFSSPAANKWFSIFVNLPILLPYAVTFRKYHREHHKYQGEDGIDVDLPTRFESLLFQTTFGKFIFFCLQVFFYVGRPLIIHPKKQKVMELVNSIIGFSFNIGWYYYLGPSGLLYFLLCTLVGTTFHPCAAHFVAEHFIYVKNYETYSYYGPLNYLNLNVGYHNEHHDFPYISGLRLPLVKKIAKEYYDNLPYHSSWVGVQWKFLVDPNITCFSRMKRKLLTPEDRKKLQ